VHFLRNALDYVSRRVDDGCLQELRWLYDRRDLTEVRRDLAAWLAKWSAKYSKLTGWVEDDIDQTRLLPRSANACASTDSRAACIWWRARSAMRGIPIWCTVRRVTDWRRPHCRPCRSTVIAVRDCC
jgi:hypothetical protein